MRNDHNAKCQMPNANCGNCRLPIADCRLKEIPATRIWHFPIGNWQLAIGNWIFAVVLAITCLPGRVHADDVPAAKHVQVDVKNKQVRVDCEELTVDMPLEFFCVQNGGQEHETVLRTAAKPSDIHFGLLMLGLKPGEPAHYSQATNQWFPPTGPPLHITCEWTENGVKKSMPATRLMRSTKDKKPMPPMTWVFDGSRVMPDGSYAADLTGYVVSIVNFDLTMIDVPKLASNANETLEWELNKDVAPKRGTPVTMIIEPAGKAEGAAAADQGVPAGQFNPGPGLGGGGGAEQPKFQQPATKPTAAGAPTLAIKADGTLAINDMAMPLDEVVKRLQDLSAGGNQMKVIVQPAPDATGRFVAAMLQTLLQNNIDFSVGTAAMAQTQPSDATAADQATLKRLKDQWEKAMSPHEQAMKAAAQTHYQVIAQMRKEQQRLVDEADRIERSIEELEKQYQDLTTPQPAQ